MTQKRVQFSKFFKKNKMIRSQVMKIISFLKIICTFCIDVVGIFHIKVYHQIDETDNINSDLFIFKCNVIFDSHFNI